MPASRGAGTAATARAGFRASRAGRSPDLAPRARRPVVVGVQRRLPVARDPVLPGVRRARSAGARRRLRHRPAAPSVPPRGPGRRRLRRLRGHDRALPREGRAGGVVAEPVRAGDARARAAAELPHDLRVRLVRAREHARAGRRGPPALPRPPGAGRDAADRHGGSVRGREAVVVLAEGRASVAAGVQAPAAEGGGPDPTAPSTRCAPACSSSTRSSSA